METADTLVKFGSSFQTKAISIILSDKEFLEQSLDIIEPDFFESSSGKWIVKTILDYFKEYKSLPTLDVFKIEGKKLLDDTMKVSIAESLKNIYHHVNDQDLNYIKMIFLEFCKNQQIKGAIIKSVDLLERGNYDEIKVLVDKALRAGTEKNVGHDWRNDILLRTTHVARNTIATPWECLNEIMDGGLGPGELGVVIGGAGAGKSWTLSAIGAAALRDGKNVLHYTFELNENYVGLRYDTIFAGIEPNKIRHNVEKVRKIIDSINGELKIKYFPSRTTSVHGLQAHLQKLEMIGFIPDLVIVDYADLMRASEKSDARYIELGYIYEELRGISGEFQFPMWTASQSQRAAQNDDIVQADRVAESFSKIMIADFVMSLSRKTNDKITNTARIHIIKNRFGPDGMTFPAKMDIAIGRFDVYSEKSSDGMLAQKEMGNDELMRKVLADKYIQIKESSLDNLEE